MTSKTTPNPNGVNYISGSGKYKHTNDANDPECASNWNYFERNGKSLILGNIPNITMQGDNKNWCALKEKPPPFTVGLKYNTVNKNTDDSLSQIQNFMFLIQEIGCKELVPGLINNIQTAPTGTEKISSDDAYLILTKDFRIMMENMPFTIDSKTKIFEAYNILVKNIVIKVSVNGVVDPVRVKENMIDIYKSFCPGSMMGTYYPPKLLTSSTEGSQPKVASLPPMQPNISSLPIQPDYLLNLTSPIKNKSGQRWVYDRVFDLKTTYNLNFELLFGIPRRIKDSDTKISGTIKNPATNTIQTFYYNNRYDKDGIIKVYFTMNNLKGPTDINILVLTGMSDEYITIERAVITSTPYTAVKSTFGSMENDDSMLDSILGSIESFGSTGSTIFIIILLIVLGLAGYLIYTNRDKIKMPSLKQRIAQFGRQIKSIKKF